MIAANISKWITLILIIGAVIFVIKAGMKIINILVMIFLLVFIWFSFFTEEGCARLTLALNAHPVIAYTTSLEKIESKSNDDITYFRTSKEVSLKGEEPNQVKCYTKWIVRLPGLDNGL